LSVNTGANESRRYRRGYRGGGQAPQLSQERRFRESEKEYEGGFKNFVLRGDVIIIAVGLVIAASKCKYCGTDQPATAAA